MKFYVCEHCGNIVTFVKSSGVPVMCCGQKMTEIVPGTTDAAVEKHVPVVKAEGAQVTVTVGAVEHPMLPEHYIEWIALETRSRSPAPKYLEMTTPAPREVPEKKLIIRKISVPEELTAARASVPRNRPTIRESAVL